MKSSSLAVVSIQKASSVKTIFREQRVPGGFTVISKHFIEVDSSISFRAKGILTYILTKPDDWEVRLDDLVRHAREGKHAVSSALKELEKAGYIEHDVIRDGRGRIVRHVIRVYEVPRKARTEASPDGGNRKVDEQGAETSAAKPESENRKVDKQPGKEAVTKARKPKRQDAEKPEVENRDLAVGTSNVERNKDKNKNNKNNNYNNKNVVVERGNSRKANNGSRAKKLEGKNGASYEDAGKKEVPAAAPGPAKELREFAEENGIKMTERFAAFYISLAGGIERAKELISICSDFMEREVLMGRKIRSVAGVLINAAKNFVTGMKFRSRIGVVQLTSASVEEREEKYRDLYVNSLDKLLVGAELAPGTV